jgi:hypothetical protein
MEDIDTHSRYKLFINSGMSEKQAEGVITYIRITVQNSLALYNQKIATKDFVNSGFSEEVASIITDFAMSEMLRLNQGENNE